MPPFALHSVTPPAWAEHALSRPATLLLDLAHCEKKAAGMVVAFLFRDPDAATAGVLARLVREELTHLEWCLRELGARKLPFERMHPSPYAGRLSALLRRGAYATGDSYLVASIIEARSGERLACLRDRTDDAQLHKLFAALCPPEERHVEILYELARAHGATDDRLEELLVAEAVILATGPSTGRVHD